MIGRSLRSHWWLGGGSMPELRGVNHVALTVIDVVRSAQFYTKLLGMTEVGSHDNESHSMRLLLHPQSGLRIALPRWSDGDGRRFDEFRVGLDHLSFAVPDRATLELWEHVL